jgi:hypothetical protein
VPNMKLPGGITVRTFPVPPASFDPAKATDRDRIRYGIPRCMLDFPEVARRWEEKFRRPLRIVPPIFRTIDYKQHHLLRLKDGHAPETTSIWSGGIVFPPRGDTMKWVEGTWRMPSAEPPAGAQDGIWYSASTWVGIDGDDGSGDVLQAGCDADVIISGGVVQHQFNPWWEWYPAGSFWISTMPVSPGDELNCLICVQSGSTNTAGIFFGNLTTGVSTFFTATAPPGVSLQGNCAEWIVESLEIDTNVPELAKYTPVVFTECNAGTVGRQTVQAGNGNTINMVDAVGNVISKGAILNATSVEVTYTGS